MIKLREINRSNGKMTCKVLIEDCEELFSFSLDMRTSSIEPIVLPENYKWCKGHVAAVQRFLLSLIDKKEIPKAWNIYWG